MDSVWDCAVDLYIKNSLRYIRAIIYVYNELWGCIMSYGGIVKYVRECKLVSTFSWISVYFLGNKYVCSFQ